MALYTAKRDALYKRLTTMSKDQLETVVLGVVEALYGEQLNTELFANPEVVGVIEKLLVQHRLVPVG